MIVCTNCNCGPEYLPGFLYSWNYYMVKDDIWNKYSQSDNMLCPDCLEKRMGRKLTFEDLSPAPLNDMNGIKYMLKLKS